MKFSTNHSGIRLHFEAGQWWLECPGCLHQGHDDMVELTVPQFDALARELGYVKAGEGQ